MQDFISSEAVCLMFTDDDVEALMTACPAVCVCLQVDPTGSGRVAAADAALFLKRSGLADLVLGKVSKKSNQCSSMTSLLCLLVVFMVINA